MPELYKSTCIPVNKFACLFLNQAACIVQTMKYGERLRAARKFAGFTQSDLVDKIGKVITQAGVSFLESGDATGSEFTVQFAIACGVRSEWLAIEQGEMVNGQDVENERIKRGVVILEQLQSESRLDDALELLDSIAKFSRKASSEKK